MNAIRDIIRRRITGDHDQYVATPRELRELRNLPRPLSKSDIKRALQ